MEKNSRKNQVTLEEVKQQLREKIKSRYNCNIRQFVLSKVAKDLGVDKNLQVYLSKGSTSVPVLNILLKHFGMKPLTVRIKIVKTITYLQ